MTVQIVDVAHLICCLFGIIMAGKFYCAATDNWLHNNKQ